MAASHLGLSWHRFHLEVQMYAADAIVTGGNSHAAFCTVCHGIASMNDSL